MKSLYIIILILFIGCILLRVFRVTSEAPRIAVDQSIMLKGILLGKMTATSYRSVPEQTDDSPFITASGGRVHRDGVALSRNLLKRWGGPVDYGNIVYIENIGFKVVNDTMNKRHFNHIDIWVKTYKEEQSFHTQYKSRKLKVYVIRIE